MKVFSFALSFFLIPENFENFFAEENAASVERAGKSILQLHLPTAIDTYLHSKLCHSRYWTLVQLCHFISFPSTSAAPASSRGRVGRRPWVISFAPILASCCRDFDRR